MGEKNLSRRKFLGLGAGAAVVAGAGLAACTQPAGSSAASAGSAGASHNATASMSGEGSKTGAATGNPSEFVPDFMTPPPVPTNIRETYECDVLVIGLGLAGCAAAKAAADEGKKVIGVDKAAELTAIIMAGDFGVVNSKIQQDLGIKWESKDIIINQLMKDMCYRPTRAFYNYWYDHSGEDFDWLVEGADFEVLTSTAANQVTDKPNYIRPKCFPPLEGYDYRTEYFPYFHGTITTDPSMQWAMEAAVAAAEAKGAEFIFATRGEQLIVEGGKVVGAYIYNDAEDFYSRVNAKAVVITTGDFGNNQKMRDYYIPWADEFACYYMVMDTNGMPANTGDGHLMAMWAGASMELGPLAPMTHHMGGALGVNSYLQLNMEGNRFMNEDIPGQPIANQLSRQPASSDPEAAARGLKSWQIFDASWPEQIAAMPDGHGYTNHLVPDDKADEYSLVLSGFGLGYTTKAMVEHFFAHGGGGVTANSIEELAAGMKLPYDKVKASIERYNALCEKGHDDDFGKDPRRLFPVKNPPFYACPFDSAGMLVVMGGIEVNGKLQPLDKDGKPIEGLYIGGNTMGGRYLIEYPVTVAGISLGTALTFGRLAGQNAAGRNIEA